MRRKLAGAALGLLLLATPVVSDAADAPPATGLILQGQLEHPRTLALSDLLALPHVDVTVAHPAGHDQRTASYTGALLWTLLSAAVPVDQPGGRTHLQHTVLARGRDGYAVAVAFGELDPNFEASRCWWRTGRTTSRLRGCGWSSQATRAPAATSKTWCPLRCADGCTA